MESAIPNHLKCPRTLGRRIDDDYQPPFPAQVARADASLKEVVMGYFGVQTIGDDRRSHAVKGLKVIVQQFAGADGPQYHDLAQYRDADGYDNLIAIAYWKAPDSFKRWHASKPVADWWNSSERLKDGVGYFREVVVPRAEQFETLYAFKDAYPGVGAIMGGASDDVQEHGYWGGMRDRIPLSQTDRLSPVGELTKAASSPGHGGRVVISGHANIAVIRSGQDWADAEADERKLYLEEIEPVLRAGMDFLRDEGKSVGCYCNRYVTHIDVDGRPLEKSFGLSHWRSLEALERWSESHPTHLAIFNKFLQTVAGFQKLRLYHEVSVVDETAQQYEYVNCHPRTGMMRDARAS